jgi:hypothetical protein
MANTGIYGSSDWRQDMSLAKEAHIDAFALNMAYGVQTNEQSVANAFTMAENLGFHLFFSFDYAGNGAWPKAQVISMLQKYAPSSAYYRHDEKPFVSTFEGTENADDWIAIKNQTGCFFVPDWSSVAANSALELAGGVVDGLFSWAAWPTDSRRMTTYVDAAYLQCLGDVGKPYMMPASPWFYTNMPGYDKNFVCHGDDLWYDRWVEVGFLNPEWVEIISWNDYGESHYIGPLNEKGYGVFTAGKAPYNYARGMPHDGWRLQLPYLIDLYKKGTASVTEESLVVWYRTQPRISCGGGNTTGFTAQLQVEEDADTWIADKLFFSALLASNASVRVSIGGDEKDTKWEFEPDGGVGVYHGSFDYDSKHLGETTVTILRNGKETVSVKGRSLTKECTGDLANLNAWVGSSTSGTTIDSVSPELSLSEQTCIEGAGSSNFTELCEFTCKYGYCPLGTCYCTAMGAPKEKPKATKDKGYPKNGDDSYEGLCSFACYYGFCPKKLCSETKASSTTSHPAPTACGNGHCTHTDTNNGLQRPLPSFDALFGLYLLIFSVLVFNTYQGERSFPRV